MFPMARQTSLWDQPSLQMTELTLDEAAEAADEAETVLSVSENPLGVAVGAKQ